MILVTLVRVEKRRWEDKKKWVFDSEGWYLAWPGRLAIGSTASGQSLLKSVGERHNYICLQLNRQ